MTSTHEFLPVPLEVSTIAELNDLPDMSVVMFPTPEGWIAFQKNGGTLFGPADVDMQIADFDESTTGRVVYIPRQTSMPQYPTKETT